MNYSFTVNKKDPKDKHDYDKIWDKFEQNGITIIYKILHSADKEIPHLHYHGVIYTKYINIKEITKEQGYRIQITSQFNPQRWFNYCMHEEKQIKTKLKEQIDDLRGQNLLKEVMNKGRPQEQQKLPTLLKISIIGNI